MLLEIVNNPCLRTEMMNFSGAIYVSLGYKTYKILVKLGHLKVLK